MSEQVSTFRLYFLRLIYLLNFVLLGSDVWPAIVSHAGAWEPMKGVAFSFWAALSLLSGLGLRYPLQMLPLILMQLLYKSVWLFAVALPQWSAVSSTDLAFAMILGLVLDLIAIPWTYVYSHFVKKGGDRWKSVSSQQ